MHHITALRVLGVLAFYAAMFVVIRLSLVVKYAEQKLFGTWDKGDFFGILHGNGWYVMGWSLADGTYPVLTLLGVRIASRRLARLAVI